MTLLDMMGETGDDNQVEEHQEFEEDGDAMEMEDHGGFELVDYNLPQRDAPVVHSAVDPVLCEACAQGDPAMFDPNCNACMDLLQSPNTTVPELYAVMRQWNPATQQNIDLLVSEILRKGGHVNDRDGLTDMTLLHYVCKSGTHGVGSVDKACDTVKLLIEKGADLYSRCRWTRMTALHYAVYFDVSPVVRLLLKSSHCLDIDSPCAEFENGTPLHIAANNLSVESAKILIHNGANLYLRDDEGRTPIDCVPQPHVFEPGSEMFLHAEKMRKQLQEGEAEIKAPMDSDERDGPEGSNSRITLEAMGLKIGDRVIVGGVKSGILRFCGTTQFAPGLWAGIELDEPAGKNDGSVSGVTYFKCSPKHGIFAPVTKICKEGTHLRTPTSRGNIDHGLIDTSHVTAKVDTGLHRRRVGSAKRPEEGEELEVGERVLVAGQRRGVIKFAGQTHFAPGWWYGIELDRPVGKNDGSVNGTRYFTCKPKHGVFAPQSRVQRITDDSRKNSAESISDHRRLAGVNNSESDSSHGARKQNTRPKSSGSSRSSSKQLISTTQTDALTLQKGMSVFCNNELGTLKYIGPVDFADGIWLGVELRTPRGKNDGSVQGKRYFTCHQNYGVLVRPSKVTVRGINGAKLLGDSNV